LQEWKNRSPELIALENLSVQIRRGAQLQALIFEELQKQINGAAAAEEGEGGGESATTVKDLLKKIQPAMSDLSDLNFFMSNRATALSGLTAKSSRRVVVDALGIDQADANDVLYKQIGSPLFSRDDVAKLMSLSTKYDRRGNPRGNPRDVPDRRGDYGPGSSSSSTSSIVKRELVEELNRLISAASSVRRDPDYRGRGGRSDARRRSRSRSPIGGGGGRRSGRRVDSRY
jgi:hypothetical protein